ncbi:hypothetical protein GTA08_BOTSDO10838 [Neofusicoccum parvum]|uniref:Uncharacterized protein n=1 Tax=Neofusicoccum parvum TaxID=310453 RepID=A0ACB5SBN5_9PEZI|nr:hypothetical protein GTA08_BOTSDO10838 [Neofusicoccum parvum]
MKETATGRINLNEEAEIVEGLLEHLYGVEVSLMKPFNASESSEQPELQNLRQQLMKLVQQYKCADKNAIPELRAQVAETFASRLQAVEDPTTILDIASAVYESTPYFDIELRSAMITQVQGHLDTILSTDETASALLENHELNLDILRRVAPILRQQTEALSSGGSGGPTPPTTPTKKRKSPRIGTHTPGTYAFKGRWS